MYKKNTSCYSVNVPFVIVNVPSAIVNAPLVILNEVKNLCGASSFALLRMTSGIILNAPSVILNEVKNLLLPVTSSFASLRMTMTGDNKKRQERTPPAKRNPQPYRNPILINQ